MQNGEAIAKLRVEKNLSREKIAELLSVGLTTYKRYEKNESPMNLEQLNTLSNIFNVSLNYLLGLTSNKKIAIIKEDIDYKYLKFSLRFIRRRERIQQYNLAKMLNLHYSTISRYERYPKKVNITYLIIFAKKFKVSIDYMCGKTLDKEIL